jgi:hypothetical protein
MIAEPVRRHRSGEANRPSPAAHIPLSTPRFAGILPRRTQADGRADNGGYASSHGCRVNCVCDQRTAAGAGPTLAGRAAPGSATRQAAAPAGKLIDDDAQFARNPPGLGGGARKCTRPQIPGLSPGGLGPQHTPSGFPCGLPPVSRSPTGFFPFVRLPLASLSPAVSGWSLRPLPGSGSPSVSLRVPFPLSNVHVSAAAPRSRRRWSQAAGTNVISSAPTTCLDRAIRPRSRWAAAGHDGISPPDRLLRAVAERTTRRTGKPRQAIHGSLPVERTPFSFLVVRPPRSAPLSHVKDAQQLVTGLMQRQRVD